MSPRKILTFSLLAFAALCAATLAYYLPRLDPAQAAAPGRPQSSADGATHQTGLLTEIDQLIVHSGMPQADPLLAGSMTAAAEPATKAAAMPAPAPPASPPAQIIQSTEIAPALALLLKTPRIQFETRSTALTGDSRDYLDSLAEKLRMQSGVKLEIGGHTDNQNRLGNNRPLSEARASAVKDYLVAQGIAAARLHAAGFGDSRPVASNNDAAGRARNRRIEFRIVR